MGLDMYLYAKNSFYGSDWSPDTEKATYNTLAALPVVSNVYRSENCSNSVGVEVPLMYWRKANAIHNWFVQNVQEGKDECQESYVGREQLEELDKLCSELFMARSPELVLERMPPTEGFFFGSTDIDEWFWEDLRATMSATSAILKQMDDGGPLRGWDIYYRSSW